MRGVSNEDSRREITGSSDGVGSNSSPNLEWGFNQTLRNVQGLLKGRSFPGKVLLTRKSEPLSECTSPGISQGFQSRYSENELGQDEHTDNSIEGEVKGPNPIYDTNLHKLNLSKVDNEITSADTQKSVSGARATDSARVTKFTKELSRPVVISEKLRELAWSGIPPYMRPNIWRLLLGYAPPNSDRREGVLQRKRLEYVECVSQYYDIPETERSDDEINMLRQIVVDCPRTVPDVTFFQQEQVQKSLERILCTWLCFLLDLC